MRIKDPKPSLDINFSNSPLKAKLSKFAPSSGANPASSVEIKSLRQIMEEEEKLLLNGTKR